MNKWLRQAVSDARNVRVRHRHAALVVRDGVVVGQGTARRTGHGPSLSENSWRCSYLHAEFAALCDAGNAARGAVLYVARVSSDGSPLLSKPCPRCAGLALRSGVSRIVWTT